MVILNISNKKIQNFRQIFHTFQTSLTFYESSARTIVRQTETAQNEKTALHLQRRKGDIQVITRTKLMPLFCICTSSRTRSARI